jgi:hypothetical protein
MGKDNKKMNIDERLEDISKIEPLLEACKEMKRFLNLLKDSGQYFSALKCPAFSEWCKKKDLIEMMDVEEENANREFYFQWLDKYRSGEVQ